jgi:hypothetical protein
MMPAGEEFYLRALQFPAMLRHSRAGWRWDIRNRRTSRQTKGFARNIQRKSRTRAAAWAQIVLLGFLTAIPAPALPSELRVETIEGYNRYIALTEQRMKKELAPGEPFLWADSLPEPRRDEVYARLQRGEVVTAKLHTNDPSGQARTPGGLLIHWVGTIFIPGASMARVLAIVQDYDRHSEFYEPEIVKSKTIERTGNDFKIYYRIRKKKIITIFLDTEYEVHRHSLDPARVYTDAFSTRIAQVEHAGEPDERQLPPGKDSGFLWRLNSYWRYFDSGRGVYVQCEAISLSRDIPTGLGWLIEPLAESVPRESLEFTLQSTRAAVLRGEQHAPQ